MKEEQIRYFSKGMVEDVDVVIYKTTPGPCSGDSNHYTVECNFNKSVKRFKTLLLANNYAVKLAKGEI